MFADAADKPTFSAALSYRSKYDTGLELARGIRARLAGMRKK
jgi:hypothetical protein